MAKRKAEPTTDGKEPKSVVEVAKQRYQRAKDFYDNSRLLSIEDTKFVMGDSDNGWQWPPEIYRDRATVNRKPCLTVNVTAQHCNQVINNIRQNRPSAKVSPVDDFADPETAKILGGMLRAIQRASNADTAHDLAAEHALYGGEGYWRVVTEYDDPKSFDQVIRIKSIANPLLVYIDPNAKEPDRSDAEWGFVFEDISKDQARDEHPGIDPSSWVEDTRRGWVREDTIRRAEYFYCDYHDDTLYLLEDGTTTLKSEIDAEDGYEAKEDGIYAGDVRVVAFVHSRKTKRKQWKWCKLLGGEEKPVDERDWPGSFLPIITVVGKELNVNGDVVRKGIVRDLKDPARMVNYSYSAAVETLALQTKIPYKASIEAIEGFEDIWGAANTDNRGYLPWNAYDEEGRQLPEPKREAPAQMATAQVQMLALSVEQMRAASGQQNANFGIKSEAQSGIGIQRLKAQGEIATFHFPDNLARALKYEATVILDLVPKVTERKQVIRTLGLDGKEEAATLDPQLDVPFAEVDAKVDKIFNPGVGKYDVAIDTGPSYQTQRQESADFISGVVDHSPEVMQVAGDLVFQTQDFPMAQEFADRFRKIPSIAALLDENGKEKVPPQVQAAMQKMQEQMHAMQESGAQLQQENADLKASRELDLKKLLIDAYGKETDRLKVVSPAMPAEAVHAIVLQTLQGIMQTPQPAEVVEPGPPQLEPAGMPEQMIEQAPQGALSLGGEPEEAPQGEQFPPEMAATGANPGLA